MKPKLEVKIGSMKLKNPVMVASGTFGYGREFEEFVDPSRLGAIVTKTITALPRQGNRPPRLYEVSSGLLNSIGLQNDGLEDFIATKIPKYSQLKTNVIVSVGGESNAEYAQIISKLDVFDAINAFEINISCPNVEYKDKIIACDDRLTHDLVRLVRRETAKPLIVKLSPNAADIAQVALAAQMAGADAVSLINTLTGMAIDVKKRKSVLGNVTGGLSGPCIKPVALRMVWQVRNKVNIPIIGMGGIMTAQDALEFIIAGASAVSVGTASFVNPEASLEVLEGIELYLKAQKIKDIHDLCGSLNIG